MTPSIWKSVALRRLVLGLVAIAVLLWAAPAGAQTPVPWRDNLVCPPERQVREAVQYCTGTDRRGQDVHVIVVDLSSPRVRFEYVLPEGFHIIYDESGAVEDRNTTAEECRDPNVPNWAGPRGGCSLANNANEYPRLHLPDAVTRAAEVRDDPPLAVVINADYAAPDASHGPEGLVVVRGVRLDGVANCDDDFNAALRPWLGLGETVDPATGLLPVDINRLDREGAAPPAWLYTGVGGGPLLVQRGVVYPGAQSCAGERVLQQPESITGCNLNQKTPSGFPRREGYSGGSCGTAPHTAAGISPDRRWLFLAISTGANTPDVLANFMAARLGVWDALKFDGGGSSQLWVAGDPEMSLLVGREERPLTNFLAVYAPQGQGVNFDHLAAPLDATTYLTLDEGDAATLDPTFRNDGPLTWKAEDGVALMEIGLGDERAWPLPHDVAPGATAGWDIPADASGVHVRRFQMAQDGVAFGEPAQFLVVIIPRALSEQSDEIRRELERIFDEAQQQGEKQLEEVARRIQEWLVDEGRELAEGLLDRLARAAEEALTALLREVEAAANSACAGAMLLPALVGLALVWTRRRP